MTQKLNIDIERVENSVGKGENAGYQHFLLFPLCFQTASFSKLLKVGIVWLILTHSQTSPAMHTIKENVREHSPTVRLISTVRGERLQPIAF